MLNVQELFIEPPIPHPFHSNEFPLWMPAGFEPNERIGITSQFLENAATYHKDYYNPDAIRSILWRMLPKEIANLEEPVFLDIGSGSGNTVIALLDMFTKPHVIALDLSENLLGILSSIVHREYSGRDVVYFCADATKGYLRDAVVDCVIGSAILHHIVDPVLALHNAAMAVRPGGYLCFMEPFEAGYSAIRLVYEHILELEPYRHPKLPDSVREAMERTIRDWSARTNVGVLRDITSSLDDKWLMTRHFFEKAAIASNCTLVSIADYDASIPLSARAVYDLFEHFEQPIPELPDWVLKQIARLDSAFSPSSRRDMICYGLVLLKKNET